MADMESSLAVWKRVSRHAGGLQLGLTEDTDTAGWAADCIPEVDKTAADRAPGVELSVLHSRRYREAVGPCIAAALDSTSRT